MLRCNTKEELSEKDLILSHCGVSVVKEFQNDIEKYALELKQLENQEHLSYEAFVKHFQIDENVFQNLYSENVGESPLEEIYKTYQFLNNKFSESREDLERINFSLDAFLSAIIARLVGQVIEAGNSERKLKNGTVLGLSKFNDDGFEFIEVPYYAFASTNVSLDLVKVTNNDGEEYSLREIDSMLGSKNSGGNFFLPNSIGVSVLLSSHTQEGEIVFVSQERNNATTLTQIANKYVASASGGVSIDLLRKGEHLTHAIDEEIKEELGIDSIQLTQKEFVESSRNKVVSILEGKTSNKVFGVKQVLESALQDRGTNELGNFIESSLTSGTIGVGLVMEEKRRNPEIIFIANTHHTIDYIKQQWESAEDKDESLSIKGITPGEIEQDFQLRANGETPIIDNHFYMSYLGFVLKGESLKRHL